MNRQTAGRRRTASFAKRLALIAFVAAAFLPACGKKGPPLPPLVKAPARPEPFLARRLGSTVYLQFRIPTTNADATSPADIERVDVNRKPRNKITGFQVRQCLEDRSIVVHAFTTGLIVKKKQAGSDEAIAEMFEVVPREIVTGVAPPVPADWYPDPSGTHQLRYWDGTRWTPQVADNGQQSVDPLGK